jgi:hypothetical protein
LDAGVKEQLNAVVRKAAAALSGEPSSRCCEPEHRRSLLQASAPRPGLQKGNQAADARHLEVSARVQTGFALVPVLQMWPSRRSLVSRFVVLRVNSCLLLLGVTLASCLLDYLRNLSCVLAH